MAIREPTCPEAPSRGREPTAEPSGNKRLTLILAGAFAVFAFALNYGLERRFDELNTFRDYNVLFDADPIAQLSSLSDGWNPYGRNLVHPNLANYFNPPVRVLEKIVTLGSRGEQDPAATRRTLAMLVVPVCSGLKALVVFAIFSLLGFSLLQTSLITGLSTLSFSQVVFGSIPDHWAIGGLSVTLSFLLVVDHLWRDGRIRWWAWLLVGTFAMGVTVTNVLIIGVVFWIALLSTQRRKVATALHVGALVLGCAALTAAIAFGMGRVYQLEQPQSATHLKDWTERHMAEHQGEKLVRFPSAIANTIAPPDVRRMENRLGLTKPDKRDFQYTLTGTPGVLSLGHPLGSFLFVLLLAGTAGGLARPAPLRVLTTVALGVVAFNAVLHSIWGREDFQYSQHYQIAVVALLAGCMTIGEGPRRVATVLFGLTLVAVVANNAVRIHEMLVVLEQINPFAR